MPYKVVKNHPSCPASKPWAVVKKDDGKKIGCHPSKAAAERQIAAIEAEEHMTANTLVQERRRNVMLFMSDDFAHDLKPNIQKFQKEDGTKGFNVLGVPVFRSGTFRNSMGEQATWEGIHIDQMVSHFDMLRKRSILPNVPVRDGHPGFLNAGSSLESGKVVGFHSALRSEEHASLHDGKEYTFLVADFEILDLAAQDSIERGLWRNRSAEVGFWVTNDEAEFWPVYRGMAYVDLPAVEGLNSFSSPHSYLFEKEPQVADPVAPPTPTPPPPPGQPVAPVAVAPALPAPPQAPQSFKVGGVDTIDFGAVQKHIDTLEGFQKDTTEQRRKDFVLALSDPGKKILATQVDSLTEFALGLSPEQYEQWSKTWESSPTNPLLAQHGSQGDGAPPDAGGTDAKTDRISILKGNVQQHQRAGMKAEAIEKTGSFKELVKLDSTFSL